ncbi:hypothetical protein [Lutibacter sp. Hel_I_33_5]|uniref:hypothetical protein n=1 Tax=Lutibacter sp. Hel_I_33_5 TaxID=1566289 RepID=UPI00119CC66C|nr:hypothetical protein [Lutibacter sp. Hel_I_33_5]
MKKLFSTEIPKNWKTNLFYDDVQSSIYTADTTKQLTETTLLDITFVNQKIVFDSIFKQKMLKKHQSNKLSLLKFEQTTLLNKPAILDIAKGTKGNFPYQIANLFVKINASNFMHVKTEVYGDSLVNERLCKSINLIERIQLK